MSLTASMWTSVSGLLNHGEKMNVIGNNIANVNTVGFKGSRMDFMDFVHQDVYAASGPTQVGRGVSIGAIYGDFSQGAFETSNESTDIAIAGNGFFRVVPRNTNESFYTRAGNFRFDSEGYLVDPHGYALQGWRIEEPSATIATIDPVNANYSAVKGSGVPTDVRLATFTANPRHTSNATVAVNLDPDMGTEKTTHATEPYAALFHTWDSTTTPALGPQSYAHPQSITVYDEGGGAHVLTVYYDKIDNSSLTNASNNQQQWEFIVTMNPEEDMREFADGAVDPTKKGLLMSGTLTFDTTGQLTDMTAYVPTSGPNMENTNTWVAAPISSNGYPMFSPNFTGRNNASETWGTLPTTGAAGTLNPDAIGFMTELNLGVRSKANWWDLSNPGSIYMSALGDDATNVPGMGANADRQHPTTTAYKAGGTGFYEHYAKQNGYAYGDLQNITITADGVVTGRYSNGITLELFQIALYDFPSKTNLRREGGNLFTETNESGDATVGAPGAGGNGTIMANAIEQSNVDISREFVNMITTQRGFQSNSKLITTTDTMLETVINMKR